jgi:hypothetical protein
MPSGNPDKELNDWLAALLLFRGIVAHLLNQGDLEYSETIFYNKVCPI